jgi:dihydroxyacetone kinase-like protein
MAATCTVDGVVAAIRAVVATVMEHRDELVTLDREIGDGDHGENLKRGFTAVLSKLTAQSVVDALGAALDGVVARGKAEPGDKTMVDALQPALLAAEKSGSTDIAEVLKIAADAADKGAQDTIPLVARKGRASYLGERSAGHMDPGARSTALLLRALAEAAS